MDACQREPEVALEYIRQFRKYSIYERINSQKADTYGEVTGTLRYQVGALRKVFPGGTLLLLVKDGRDIVRSIFPWPFYEKGAKGAYALEPLPGDPYFAEWSNMTRFEKLCWSWLDANRILLEHIPVKHAVKLESLTRDFSYFKQNVVDRLGLSLTYEQWWASVKVQSPNASKNYAFPHWSEWSQGEVDAFERICGKMMERLGYEL